ncbi:uncharacterized protein LOC132273562 [Cornus florida]|uniref:uncharacterized protein LOC132273562 n=1 Tax=Cornus florida TaxID=4283 RepID=UPI00289663F6|nr:uncharacterized protein LOC132273562 [Cornus florida]XP_059630511.1 uncharacterized protein LOC132273562 [Cornus florida]
MEGNLSSGNMIIGGGSYGGIDLQGSIRNNPQRHPLTVHQQHHSLPRQGSMVHPSIHEGFALRIGSMHDSDHNISLADYPKGERGKTSASDEDEPSFTEDMIDSQNDANRGKKGSPWQRVKWTDTMVKLLITAVSYIAEDAAAEYENRPRRKYANLHKKGKWKSVSKVMAERGHYVSPQQCEDKFNDLNKRYKRLNEILGRGTSCEVVERPELLDMLGHVSEKGKEEVRKILSSKQLFYEEMCSYHNGNRLHLPPDPELQRSMRLALRSRDDSEDTDVGRHPQDDFDEDDQDAETDDRDEFEQNHALCGDLRGTYGLPGSSGKKLKLWKGHEEFSFMNSLNSLDYNKNFNSYPQTAHADIIQVLPEAVKANLLQKQRMECHSVQLEEQKLQVQAQMLELEKERFKWQRICRKRDRELEMMRMENERMKLENERMALELKQKEIGADRN